MYAYEKYHAQRTSPLGVVSQFVRERRPYNFVARDYTAKAYRIVSPEMSPPLASCRIYISIDLKAVALIAKLTDEWSLLCTD